MRTKFRLRKVQIGMYTVWRLDFPYQGHQYFYFWDGAIRYMDRVIKAGVFGA